MKCTEKDIWTRVVYEFTVNERILCSLTRVLSIFGRWVWPSVISVGLYSIRSLISDPISGLSTSEFIDWMLAQCMVLNCLSWLSMRPLWVTSLEKIRLWYQFRQKILELIKHKLKLKSLTWPGQLLSLYKLYEVRIWDPILTFLSHFARILIFCTTLSIVHVYLFAPTWLKS